MFLRPRLIVLIAVPVAAACAQPVVSVEVMPPRTSITCDAPTVDDPSLGTGLMDAKATDTVHGGYIEDLRMSLPGANAVVNGISVKITRDGSELKTIDNVPTGDVDLVGTKDDIRRAIVENAVLVPRETAVTLSNDSSITDVDFATLVINITPLVVDPDVTGQASSFALNVCNGCLVDQPPASQCAVVAKNPSVCRAGQDVPSFTCAQAAAP
jgi:hypothetical protein